MFSELLILIICWLFYSHYNRKKHLPPGPPSMPIVGSLVNLFSKGRNAGMIGDMVVAREFWKYEDMYTLFLGPKLEAIVINDFELAKDLFFRDEFSGT